MLFNSISSLSVTLYPTAKHTRENRTSEFLFQTVLVLQEINIEVYILFWISPRQSNLYCDSTKNVFICASNFITIFISNVYYIYANI